MGKKNSADPASRIHRAPKSAGKPSGRGFTGHRGRGRGRSFGRLDHEDIGAEDRPGSLVDDDEGDGSEEGSDGSKSGGITINLILLSLT